MNQREKTLAMMTGAAAVGFIAWSLLGGGESDVAAGGTGRVSATDLDNAKQQYVEVIDQIRVAPDIRRQFLELVGQNTANTLGAEDGAQRERADIEFQNQVVEWAQTIGFSTPNVGAMTEDIYRPGGGREMIEQYQLVVVQISIRDGDLPRLAELLKVFEQRGLIIQRVRMDGQLDSRRVSAEITVARLVEAFFPTRERDRLRRG